MKLTISVIAFFFTFFRVEVIQPGYYISIVFGALGIIYFAKKPDYTLIKKVFSREATYCILLISTLTLALDVFSGISDYSSNSFSLRIVGLLLLSLLPAYYISAYYIRSDLVKFYRIISICFWLQFGLWVATYLSPSFKELVYVVTARPDSVNLLHWNMSARGFGVSKEVNFTSPYMMVFTALLISRDKLLSIATVLTQLLNSNLAAIAIVMSILLTKLKIYQKLIIVTATGALIIYFGDEVFSRFYREFMGGDVRTLRSLTSNHIFFLNEGLLEHMFGSGLYVFQDGGRYSSDVGWVIMYNYGGFVFCLLFLVFLHALCFRSFGYSAIGLGFFLSAIALNSKGLLFGPNSYYFMLFITSFVFNSSEVKRKTKSSLRRSSV